MSARPLNGIPLDEVRRIMREGIPKGDALTPINARCDKCGVNLRAVPILLEHIRNGVVDHKDCGGMFQTFTPEPQ